MKFSACEIDSMRSSALIVVVIVFSMVGASLGTLGEPWRPNYPPCDYLGAYTGLALWWPLLNCRKIAIATYESR